jgi:PmbA protein
MKNNIRIIDNPLLIRGLSSRPFDAEGVVGEEIDLVKDGVILSWLLDNSTAKQLNMKTNGRASRSVSSPPSPSPTNLYLEKGLLSPLDLIKDVNEGFYITDLVGMGVNMVNGDYSRGAVGFKIKNGEITFPVNEITIADNLLNMFKKMTPANDLSFNFSINSPTLLIEDMTVAGI